MALHVRASSEVTLIPTHYPAPEIMGNWCNAANWNDLLTHPPSVTDASPKEQSHDSGSVKQSGCLQ
ncbi:MAG: hypothetical protein IPG38_19105 [Chitinophagaceae bacterium]|nr:hypothetical protein [Chitinophagaceae bacterium]